MSQESTTRFEFQPGIPLTAIEPGTNVLVRGDASRGARELALSLLLDGQTRGDSVVVIAADVPGPSLLEWCEDVSHQLDRTRLGIVDCSGSDEDDQSRFESHAEPIDDPADLPAIEVELSTLYETLARGDPDGIRIGLFSVSALFEHAEFRTASRFVHMLTGRVIAMEDLGVFHLDQAAVDERTATAVEQFCDGAIEVRSGDVHEYELRTEGLENQPESWTPVSFDHTD